jgi:antagonist of KipI
VLVRGGTELAIGPAPEGCRAYLAVAGGIDTPRVLGSRSTHLRGGFGGMEGRALRAGDTLPIGTPSPESIGIVQDLGARRTGWSADRLRIAEPGMGGAVGSGPVRAIAGPHFTHLDAESRRLLATATYRVSPQSDRMGGRLIGPILRFVEPIEMISEAVVTGTIQLPPDGQPIVLLADRQTTGGYPVIGHVISADRSAMAQRRPGDPLAFSWVTLEVAEQALLAHRRALDVSVRGLHLQRAGR